MKIIRSAKCSLKFTTASKRKQLADIMAEYSKVVNFFIKHFWDNGVIPKMKLLKSVYDLPKDKTWLGATIRLEAAHEALGIVVSTRNHPSEKKSMPIHQGKEMTLTSHEISFQESGAKEFDVWLHFHSIGNHLIFDIPIKFHKQFNKWAAKGRRFNAYIVTPNYVQFQFEIETGEKREVCEKPIGIDTGMNVLAATSDGKKHGEDIKSIIEAIKRCKHGSKRQKSLRRYLRQRMDEVAREVTKDTDLIVVEGLKKLNNKTKLTRRVSGNMRRLLGAWAYRYWLQRLRMTCDENRVRFACVPPYKTSQRCSMCGFTEQKNRCGGKFLCLKCGYASDADTNAAKNILHRFISGPYGARCKPKAEEAKGTVHYELVFLSRHLAFI